MITQAKITVAAPPRDPTLGPWPAAQSFTVQSLRGQFSFGTQPGTAVLTYVGGNVGPAWIGARVGANVSVEIGNHFFSGLCISDTLLVGSRGGVRTLEFRDLREYLSWDFVHGYFNQPFRQMVGGFWRKRYEHVYPADFNHRIRTFTDRPLLGWEIVNLILGAPTVGSPWQWDFTGNGLFPGGLLNAPIFDLNFINGTRLDAALAAICEKTGLVIGLDSRASTPYRLVFMRKGYGLLPVFPDNCDERRLGLSLSGNPTNIRVLGDRNRYQVLNLDMKPDWTPAWEQFLVGDDLAEDLYQNENDLASGVAYNALPDDPEHWKGGMLAKIRALNITVGEYVALRNARSDDGNQFADQRKFAQRSRMDMPAWIYIEKLLFRAFRPTVDYLINAAGARIPLSSVNIVEQQCCRVTYDPLTGGMEDDPDEPTDGNGLAVVQGYQFGEDFFQLVKPERITSDFFNTPNCWTAAPFQADDSGEGERFIIFDQPVFTASTAAGKTLLVEYNGNKVLNAAAELLVPTVRCALTFEMENFSYYAGTYPNVSRDQVEFVSGLCQEFSGTPGSYREVLFADGDSANAQAAIIADSRLLCQYTYVTGGYNLKWVPSMPVSRFGTALGSLIDRVEIEISRSGVMQVTELTTERQRDNFEPERDLDRKTLGNSLFPGQAELRQKSNDYQRLLAGIRATPRETFGRFMDFLRGNFDATDEVRFDLGLTPAIPDGAVIAAGSALFKLPSTTTQGSPATGTLVVYPANYDPALHLEFVGVTVRDNEPAGRAAALLVVKKTGDCVALVQGPVTAGDTIGAPTAAGGSAYTTGAAFNALVSGGTLGIALQTIADASVKLIKVRLGAGGGGGSTANWNYRGLWTASPLSAYMTFDVVQFGSGTAAGMYLSTIDANSNQPDTGIGWTQVSSSSGTWL